MRIYRHHIDPSHGWLEVPIEDFPPGFLPTHYSYHSRDGKTAYLEEDCDAARFLDAVEADITDGDNNASWIRKLPRFPKYCP